MTEIIFAICIFMYASGCLAFGYFLGWRAGEREGFEAGKTYQKIERAGEDIRNYDGFNIINEN